MHRGIFFSFLNQIWTHSVNAHSLMHRDFIWMFSYCECEYVNLFSIDQICLGHTIYLPPTNEVCEGYVFTPVCQSFCSQGGGGARGCQGACMVARGHAWLWGGCAWFWGDAWLLGGMRGCKGGVHGCRGVCGCRGACVVVRGVCGCGGMHGCRGGVHVCGGECVVAGQVCVGYDEIRSMSRRYASYWNSFLPCNVFLSVSIWLVRNTRI